MTESTSAPVSAVQPAATNSPKKQQKKINKKQIKSWFITSKIFGYD